MNGALEKNQRLTLSCARLGSELEGVCSHEGMAVFVPGVLPGETAEVQIVKALPNYAFGRLVQVLEPSAQRAQPRCPVYDKCGGCSGQHMTYEATLEAKRQQVWDCLNRIAGLELHGRTLGETRGCHEENNMAQHDYKRRTHFQRQTSRSFQRHRQFSRHG